jgi:hypothetical protein
MANSASPTLLHSRAAAAPAPFAPRLGQYLFFAVCVLALGATTFALAAPPLLSRISVSGAAQTSAAGTGPSAGPVAPAPAVPAWSAQHTSEVLSYVDGMRPDDSLVQVRPSVFAKRSNVQGLAVAGRTVYYDVFPHQSFGPLRTGKATERDVNVLAREADGNTLVLIYTLK